MKIIYDYRTFIRQFRGGISRYFYEIIRRIARDETRKIYLYQGLHINDFDMSKVSGLAGYFGVRHRKIPKSGPALELINGLLMEYWAASRVGKCDILHYTYYGRPHARASKTVATVYDMIHEIFPDTLKGAAAVSKSKRETVGRAQAVLAISECTKKDLVERFGTDPDKIHVTHLAASEIFAPASVDEQREFKSRFSSGRPYALYVGDRGGYKNFGVLLRAAGIASVFKDITIACAGGGAARAEEISEIKASGIAGKVRFLGAVDDKTLRMLYSCAECVAVTSLYEGFGLTALEAMKCGTPVVCARASSLPEVAGEAALYFEPSSPEDLAGRLEKLISDRTLRDKLAAAGIERSGKFDWDKTAAETLKVYDKLAA